MSNPDRERWIIVRPASPWGLHQLFERPADEAMLHWFERELKPPYKGLAVCNSEPQARELISREPDDGRGSWEPSSCANLDVVKAFCREKQIKAFSLCASSGIWEGYWVGD